MKDGDGARGGKGVTVNNMTVGSDPFFFIVLEYVEWLAAPMLGREPFEANRCQ